MAAGRIAMQSGPDGIDLQIKFSFTVTPLPLRGNGVNSPARLHRSGSLKRPASRLILANLPKSCSINIAAMQRFSLATELRTLEGCSTGQGISLYKQPSIVENCSLIGGRPRHVSRPLRKLNAENVIGWHAVRVCPSRRIDLPPWDFIGFPPYRVADVFVMVFRGIVPLINNNVRWNLDYHQYSGYLFLSQ